MIASSRSEIYNEPILFASQVLYCILLWWYDGHVYIVIYFELVRHPVLDAWSCCFMTDVGKSFTVDGYMRRIINGVCKEYILLLNIVFMNVWSSFSMYKACCFCLCCRLVLFTAGPRGRLQRREL